MNYETLAVPAAASGVRLDLFLTQQWGQVSLQERVSRSEVQRLILEGQITVNGQRAKASARLRAEDLVQICHVAPSESPLQAEVLPLDILFEDADCVVLNKAAGMVVHPAAGISRGTLVNALLHHCPQLAGIGGERRPGIVHRLDKDTSGVMIVAKHREALEKLAEQFRDRSVSKEYLALVWGAVKAERGIIDRPIGRHRSDRKKMSSLHALPHQRTAVTEWHVEARYEVKGTAVGSVTLLRLKPRTGRTHQLRVHLADMKHPLVGDSVYGGRLGKAASGDPELSALHSFARQALHAERLAIDHPRSLERMEFIAPLPADMQNLIASLPQAQLKR
jgi:23S rRNA pseudouridine1911/1915/1917 synthase